MDIKYVLIVISISSASIAMDDPQQPRLFTDVLGADVRNELLPIYMASARADVRDNRGDTLAEQIHSAQTYRQFLKQQYKTDISDRDATFIDIILRQIPPLPKTTICLPNRICLTALYNSHLLRTEFRNPTIKEARIAEFQALPQEEKDISVVHVMRLCPSAHVLAGLLQAGASANACDPKSYYSVLRLALEANVSVKRKKRLLDLLMKVNGLDLDRADKHSITPLARAVSLEDEYTVDALLAGGAHVNAMDHAYNTPIGIAARKGNVRIIQKLLSKDPNMYLCNPYYFDNNVLVQATKCSDVSKVVPLLETLVSACSHRGDISKMREFEYFVNVALVEAARRGLTDAVNFLMHMTDVTGKPLQTSPPFFNPDFVMVEHDHSALTASLAHEHFDIALSLLQNAPEAIKHSLSTSKEMREKALRLATRLRAQREQATDRHACNTLDAIIDRMLQTEVTPAHDALWLLPACIEAASLNNQTLLAKFADHARVKDPFILQKALLSAAAPVNPPAIYTLLDYEYGTDGQPCRINPDVTDMNGETPLLKVACAADSKTLRAIDTLLAFEANIYRTNKWGHTVFHKAVINADPHARLMALDMFAEHIGQPELLANMINTPSLDTGDTPLLVACALPDRLETIEKLLEMGAHVHVANKKGETPVLIASAHFQVDVLELLLQKGADPNRTNLSGCGPLTKAAGARPYQEQETANARQIIRLLRKHGARLEDFKDSMVRNAARHGNTQLVHDLLNVGADIQKGSTSFENTALGKAAQKGHSDTVELLLTCSDPDQKNSVGKKALELAVEGGGTYDIIEMLLYHHKAKP